MVKALRAASRRNFTGGALMSRATHGGLRLGSVLGRAQAKGRIGEGMRMDYEMVAGGRGGLYSTRGLCSSIHASTHAQANSSFSGRCRETQTTTRCSYPGTFDIAHPHSACTSSDAPAPTNGYPHSHCDCNGEADPNISGGDLRNPDSVADESTKCPPGAFIEHRLLLSHRHDD